MSPPTFTVVMPAHNAAATVGAAIRSVLAQTRPDFELIVVDDASADDTAARIRPFEADPRVRSFRVENRQLAATRNAAIAQARGGFVSLLDSDDLWLPSYLEAMGNALERDSDAGFAYTDAWVLDDATRRIRRTTAMKYQRPPIQPPSDPEELLALLLRRNFIFTSATVRRSVFERVGLYNPSLSAAEDYELWLRIVAHGYRAARASGVLAVYRKRPGSISTDDLLMARSEREVFRLVAEDYDVSERIRSIARARMRLRDGQLASLTGNKGALALAYQARARLLEVKRRAVEPIAWYRTVPGEVAAAFPDLTAV